MNTMMGRAQSARKPLKRQRPSAADFAEGRVRHDWTGPDRWHVYVHCSYCEKIFKVMESHTGPCPGPVPSAGEQSK